MGALVRIPARRRAGRRLPPDLLGKEPGDDRCSHEDHRAVDGKPEVHSAQSRFDNFGNLSAEKDSARALTVGVPMVDAVCWVYPARPLTSPCSTSGSPEVTATV